MTQNLELALKIKALVDGLGDINKLANEVKGLAGQASKGVPDSTSKFRAGLAATGQAVQGLKQSIFSLRGAFVALGAGAALRGIVRTASEFEQLRSQLKTLTGSAQAAEKAFRDIQQVAKNTDSPLKDITEAALRLRKAGIEPTIPMLTAFADAAAAMGKSTVEFTDAVFATALGSTRALREFGIKAEAEGENIKFTYKGVSTSVRNDIGAITAHLEQLARANFAGAARAQANTLSGAFDNLKAAAALLADEVGRAGLNDALRDLAQQLTTVAEDGSGAARTLGQELAAAVRLLGDALAGMVKHKEALIVMASAFLGLKLAMAATALSSNKQVKIYAAVIGVLAGVAGGFAVLNELNKEIEKTQSGAAAATKDHAGALADLNEEGKKTPPPVPPPSAAMLAARRKLTQALLDGDTRLLLDALARQKAAMGDTQADSLFDFRDYYTERARIQTEALDAEIRRTQAELAAERALPKGETEEDRAQILINIKQLEIDLTLLQRKRAEAGIEGARDQAQAEDELAKQLDSAIAAETALVKKGADRSRLAALEAARYKILSSAARQRYTLELSLLTENARKAKKYIEDTITDEREKSSALKSLETGTANERLRINRDYHTKLLQLRDAAVSNYTKYRDEIISLEKEIAGVKQSTADKIFDIQQKYLAPVEQWNAVQAKIKEALSAIKQANVDSDAGFENAKEAVVRAKEFADKLGNIPGFEQLSLDTGIVKALQDISAAEVGLLERRKAATEKFAQQEQTTFAALNTQIAETAKSIDILSEKKIVIAAQLDQASVAGVLEQLRTLFNTRINVLVTAAAGVNAAVRHAGGLAGASGPTRMLPLAAFANAVRLHEGGIPGLRRNEVPTILERGEEVLTRNDPRHRFNGAGGANLGTLNFNIGGTPATVYSDRKTAETLRRAFSDVGKSGYGIRMM